MASAADLAPLGHTIVYIGTSPGKADDAAIYICRMNTTTGALSDPSSARGDSFSGRGLSAPSYTRPPEFRGHAVPDVLLSGDHAKIEKWRIEQGERLTRGRKRAD